MIRYINVFSGANGAAPADLVLSEVTGSGGTRDIQSNKFRMLTTATNGNTQRAILPSATWNEADGKATVWFSTVATVGSMVPQIIMRASGNWDTEVDSPVTGYKLLHNAGNLQMYKRTGGTTTQLGSDVAFTVNASTTYGMTFQTVGTALKGRIWTGAEPGTWQIEVTDAAISGPGQFQMALLGQAAVREVDWDDLSLDDLVVGELGVRPGRQVFR